MHFGRMLMVLTPKCIPINVLSGFHLVEEGRVLI